MDVETDTLVIGAGPAGLGMAARLHAAERPYVILEAGDRVGFRWRRHYDRLHLHTDRRFSGLPLWPIPDRFPKYLSRDEFGEYLEQYRARFEIEPRLEARVERVHRDTDDWVTSTEGGEVRSRRIVFATGANCVPKRPALAGEDQFTGEVVHSRGYTNATPYAGKHVLVVGIGNTGGEIALDLAEHGAASVRLSVRSPINVMPKEILGTCAQVNAIRSAWLPAPVQDKVGHLLSWMYYGDLAKYGLRRADKGHFSSIRDLGRVPLLDIGTMDMIARGRIEVVPGIERLHAHQVELTDGRRVEVDRIVLATGYHSGLPELIDDPASAALLNDRGQPPVIGAEAGLPGAYFVGYTNPSTGILRHIAIDSAKVIEAMRAAAPASRPV